MRTFLVILAVLVCILASVICYNVNPAPESGWWAFLILAVFALVFGLEDTQYVDDAPEPDREEKARAYIASKTMQEQDIPPLVGDLAPWEVPYCTLISAMKGGHKGHPEDHTDTVLHRVLWQLTDALARGPVVVLPCRHTVATVTGGYYERHPCEFPTMAQLDACLQSMQVFETFYDDERCRLNGRHSPARALAYLRRHLQTRRDCLGKQAEEDA